MLTTARFLKHILEHPLNENRGAQTLIRWLKWQVGSRIVPGAVVIDFVNDAKLLIKPGMRGATENIYTGLYDLKDMAFLLHLLKEGDLFVDVGANVGTYTILASACCKANSVSIEPIYSTFNSLSQNVSLNNLASHVVLLNIGVGDQESVLKFTNSLDCTNHVLSEDEVEVSNFVEVPVRRLDDILAGKNPTLIKIDVEGFESQVISGASNILRSESLLGVIMELNDSGTRYGYEDDAIHSKMVEFGFSSFDYDPFCKTLTSSSGKDSGNRNTLYLRNLSWIQEKIEASSKFRVLDREI
jgi:FkbM family methyltransferase